jgi:Tfp pilus assembly protein PilN
VSTQVNLLPPETRERQVARRQTTLVAVAGAAVIVLIALFYALQVFAQSDVEDQLQQQQQQNAALQQQAAELQKFEDLRTQLQARRSLVAQTLGGEILWSEVLQDLSRVIPPGMWLTSLSATVSGAQMAETGASPAPAPTGGPANPELIGSLTFQGNSLDTQTLSEWLTRLEQVPGWVNAWLSKAERGPSGGQQIYSFNGSVDLSQALVSRRGG